MGRVVSSFLKRSTKGIESLQYAKQMGENSKFFFCFSFGFSQKSKVVFGFLAVNVSRKIPFLDVSIKHENTDRNMICCKNNLVWQKLFPTSDIMWTIKYHLVAI